MFSIFRRKVDAVQKETSAGTEEQQQHSTTTATATTKKQTVRYRQWLFDRIHGIPRPLEGKHDRPDPFPPSVLCLPTSTILCCPYLLEENYLCTMVGRLGCCRASWARNAVMRYSLVLNTLCLLTGLFSCLSISDSKFHLLQVASMEEIELVPDPSTFSAFAIQLYIGLSAMVIDNPSTGVQEVVRFDQFCTLVDARSGLEAFIKSPVEENCHNCENLRPQMVIGLIVAIACLVPSMISQCTRLYETTDINCTKCWALLLELISLAGILLTWYQFSYGCLRGTFIDGQEGYTLDGQFAEPDSISEAVRVDFDWRSGYAMICLYATFALKLVSSLCDCCLPTPMITRNTYEQKVYESKTRSGGIPDPESGDHQDRDNSFSEDHDNDEDDNSNKDDDKDDDDDDSILSYDSPSTNRT